MKSTGFPTKQHQNRCGEAPPQNAEKKLAIPMMRKTRPTAAMSGPAMRRKERVPLCFAVCSLLIFRVVDSTYRGIKPERHRVAVRSSAYFCASAA